MLLGIFNHFRLTWHLIRDKRVNGWLKFFLVTLPLVYAAIPLPDDAAPVIGMLDDMIFMGLATLIFIALCPNTVVAEHRLRLLGRSRDSSTNLDYYRHPNETRDLAIGFAITSGLLAIFGYLAGVLGLLFLLLGYIGARVMRGQIMGNAVQITEAQLPQLFSAFQAARRNLTPVNVDLYVTQDPRMNAYAFGYSEPYVVVLTSGLVEKLSQQEIQAIIGHELGHIHLGHVRLINLMSGMGGWLRLFFYRWSRSCEYSADAVALQVCNGNAEPVVTSLLKLSSGLNNVPVDLQAFLHQSEQGGGESSVAEILSTHPFISNRIRRLVEMANNWSSTQDDGRLTPEGIAP